MFAATRDWFKRYRGSFAIGFGLVGAGYVATQYALSRFLEARERMGSDRIAKENLKRRFQQNQEDCTFTVLALLPTATDNILDAVPVEQITHELQQIRAERLAKSEATPSEVSMGSVALGGGEEDPTRSMTGSSSMVVVPPSGDEGAAKPKRTRVQLWNELKINSLTRAFTLTYTLALLTLLTRIQLNLLGRRNYLSSVVSLAAPAPNASTISLENHDDDGLAGQPQPYGSDFETNRQYLTFSWWLLHKGWRQVMTRVEEAVKKHFGPLNPRDDVTLGRISELTLEVRMAVEGVTEEDRRNAKWLEYLLPPRSEEIKLLQLAGDNSTADPAKAPQFSALLRRLLDETADLIESPSFTQVLTSLLDAGFSLLVDENIAVQAFKLPPPPEPGVRLAELPDPNAKTKLATVLAVATRQAHLIGNGVPNHYLQAMDQAGDLEAFAAVVYSSHFDSEVPDSGVLDMSPPLAPGQVSKRTSLMVPETEKLDFGDALIIEQPKPEVSEMTDFESAWDKALATPPAASAVLSPVASEKLEKE